MLASNGRKKPLLAHLISPVLSVRHKRSFLRDKNGATAIEFGLIGIPFFMLLFAILEVGLSFMVNRLVDDAVSNAARLIKTGQAAEQGFSADEFASQICGFLPSFLCLDDRIIVSVSKVNDFQNITSLDELYDDEGNLITENQYTDTGASEIVVVNVIYRWPMLVSWLSLNEADAGSERHLSSTMVFRNEPWQ